MYSNMRFLNSILVWAVLPTNSEVVNFAVLTVAQEEKNSSATVSRMREIIFWFDYTNIQAPSINMIKKA